MSKTEKIKKTLLIALGFALSTYFIMSGIAILQNSSDNTLKDQNISRGVK